MKVATYGDKDDGTHDFSACDDAECETCAANDCPSGEPLHYHHDGCPACDGPAPPASVPSGSGPW